MIHFDNEKYRLRLDKENNLAELIAIDSGKVNFWLVAYEQYGTETISKEEDPVFILDKIRKANVDFEGDSVYEEGEVVGTFDYEAAVSPNIKIFFDNAKMVDGLKIETEHIEGEDWVKNIEISNSIIGGDIRVPDTVLRVKGNLCVKNSLTSLMCTQKDGVQTLGKIEIGEAKVLDSIIRTNMGGADSIGGVGNRVNISNYINYCKLSVDRNYDHRISDLKICNSLEGYLFIDKSVKETNINFSNVLAKGISSLSFSNMSKGKVDVKNVELNARFSFYDNTGKVDNCLYVDGGEALKNQEIIVDNIVLSAANSKIFTEKLTLSGRKDSKKTEISLYSSDIRAGKIDIQEAGTFGATHTNINIGKGIFKNDEKNYSTSFKNSQIDLPIFNFLRLGKDITISNTTINASEKIDIGKDDRSLLLSATRIDGSDISLRFGKTSICNHPIMSYCGEIDEKGSINENPEIQKESLKFAKFDKTYEQAVNDYEKNIEIGM